MRAKRRAVPVGNEPAVHAFRAEDGCGWLNGKWLLMGSHQPVRSGQDARIVVRIVSEYPILPDCAR